jgi:1,4-alpha-glucan branching enzyme
VRHPEWDNFLEEQWLFEAVVETYAPLVLMLEELRREHIPARLTMTLSPTLLMMLDDELLHSRTVRYINTRLRLLYDEAVRHEKDDDPFKPLVEFYTGRLIQIRDLLNGRGGLLRALRALQDADIIEIITCGATHGFLPHLIHSPGSVERQVRVGVGVYERILGRKPNGIWLPECGFTQGIDSILASEGIKFFFVESHAIELAAPGEKLPAGEPLIPVKCPTGPVAFGRDRETSKAVWSAEEGYPGDYNYRDFYRDVGFDLPDEEIAPYLPPAVAHTFTGIKYYAITGETDKKDPYDRDLALESAKLHAEDFVRRVQGRLSWMEESGLKTPTVVCPYDAELFGHWWFEGMDWLGDVFRGLSKIGDIDSLTPSDYLRRGGEIRRGMPAHSSWGDGGYGEVWGSDQAEWIYPHIYGLNRHLKRLKAKFGNHPDPQVHNALLQYERELLLLESSDWPFILHTGTQAGYANIRLAEHITACREIRDMLDTGVMDHLRLSEYMWKHPCFTETDFKQS